MAKWSLVVPIRLCPLINHMSTAICTCIFVLLLLTKPFLKKAAQLKLVGRIKERTRGFHFTFISYCTAIDCFGYANYLQSTHREYAHVGCSLRER